MSNDEIMHCRTCNQPITFEVTERDFIAENGGISAATSKLIECPSCGEMNVRYFSYDAEFENVDRPFAAVQTSHVTIRDDTVDLSECVTRSRRDVM